MIAHLSYVICDRCGAPASIGDDAREARVHAENEGFERRNWNIRIKDVCPACQSKAERVESGGGTS